MATSRTRLALGAAALALVGAAGWAQDRPESILPPGFGVPATPAPAPKPRAPAPTPAGTAPPTSLAAPATPSPTPTPAPAPAASGDETALDNSATPAPAPAMTPAQFAQALAEYDMPAAAAHSLAVIGLTDQRRGFGTDAFGAADGRYLETLMRRQDGQIASRWMAIALRRALVAATATPAKLNGADFAAERAWLLLRMGEPVAARAVVQDIDPANYTSKLYQVAMQVALATGDPAALCPLAPGALRVTDAAGWRLAQAICIGLAGDAAKGLAAVRAARREHVAGGIDLKLAEKVVGAAGQGHQAVTIEWDPVSQLTAWRWGLATATGVTVPDDLYRTVQPQVTGWRALSPDIALADRIGPAEAAATRGILSNAALVDLYSQVRSADDQPPAAVTTANDLRQAYVAGSADQRTAALRRLWGDGSLIPYARLVLTARAATRVTPAADSPDADRVVASMLSAGLDRTAMRWWGHVTQGTDAWAMLLVADPDASESISYGTLSNYSGSGDAALKQRLLLAGLAGLGRLSPADAQRAASTLDVRIGAENAWTRALDRAVEGNEPATVVLLCATGMQTDDWRGVSPAALYRIVDALRRVGLGGEARMIAAEAIART